MAKAPSNEIMKPCLLCLLVTALDKHCDDGALDKHCDVGATRLGDNDCRSVAGKVHNYASQTVVCQ